MSHALRPPGTPRRSFLRALALAPAATAAACATGRGGSASAGAPRKEAAAAPGSEAGAAQEALAAVRAVPLALDVEPAFVFRALAARSRE
ncbi:hypothetical protein [Anaeromyxobacter oryzae]|uniref:Uncharacterized protein n=1 Tax=Anaeromyxobacter oryzae TaxID=2918170 RepID=A0ABM7WX62_9BACT|nr:hypothetical protein [Anaeromyxobacter oryzae]BDG04100.1 hypothetical protein AMOR_30960 [Anaeromyxobacter oryzae]